MRKKLIKSTKVAGAFLALSAPDAEAQRAEPDTTPQLSRVTITATRTPMSVLRVPLAVSIVGRSSLALSRGYGFEDALNLVPGVFAQSRSGNQDARITIRGFGARGAGDRSNAGTSRGIRVLIDGFPETEPDGRTAFDGIDLASTERIDVVRSNASATWGNAAGGVLNISTVPEIANSMMSAQQIAGSFGLMRTALRGGVSVGSGDIYGSLATSSYDGWREGSSSRRNVLNVGGTSRLSDATTLGAFVMGTNNLFHIPGPLTMAQVEDDPSQANAAYLSRRERRYNRTARFGVSLDHRPESGTQFSAMLYANPKYLQRSERGTFRDFTRYHVGGNASAGFRGNLTKTVSSHLVIGADEAYQDGAILFYGLTNGERNARDLRDNKREGANNFGLFVHDELRFGESVSLTLGARYDNITYHGESFINPNLNSVKHFKGFTPKVGLSKMLSPTRSVYVSLGGGVEAPAGNETDPAGTFGQDTIYAINPALEPIRSTTIEVGTKHIVPLGTGFLQDLSYDVAVYRTGVKNEIVPYRGGRFYFTAARAERSGAEFGLSLRAKSGIFLNTALTLSKNTYEDYRVDSVHYNLALAGHFADFSGHDVVGVPKSMAHVVLGLSPNAWRGAGINLGWHAVSNYFADDANNITVPGYGTMSATLNLGRPVEIAGGVGLQGFFTVNNLFDRSYLESAFLNPDIVNGVPVAFEPGMPRNIVVSLSLSRTR
jgi:iron complex outermembrane receptor protein